MTIFGQCYNVLALIYLVSSVGEKNGRIKIVSNFETVIYYQCVE